MHMLTRILVVAIALLALPEIATAGAHDEGVKVVLKKKYGSGGDAYSARSRHTMPSPIPQFKDSEPALMSARRETGALSQHEKRSNHLVRTVFVRYWFTNVAITFNVPEYKRTNRFVESQSGSDPIHVNNGSLRKI